MQRSRSKIFLESLTLASYQAYIFSSREIPRSKNFLEKGISGFLHISKPKKSAQSEPKHKLEVIESESTTMDKDSVTTIFNKIISDVTDVLGNMVSIEEKEEQRLKTIGEMETHEIEAINKIQRAMRKKKALKAAYADTQWKCFSHLDTLGEAEMYHLSIFMQTLIDNIPSEEIVQIDATAHLMRDSGSESDDDFSSSSGNRGDRMETGAGSGSGSESGSANAKLQLLRSVSDIHIRPIINLSNIFQHDTSIKTLNFDSATG